MGLYIANGRRRIQAYRTGVSGIDGTIIAVTLLTSGSNLVFTPQTNSRVLWVRGIAGGGAGGGAANAQSNSSGGAGGSSGAYFDRVFFTGTRKYVYTIGVGGTGVSGGTGNVGGDTSWGTITARGGNGGLAGVSVVAPNIRRNGVNTTNPITVDGADINRTTSFGAIGKNQGGNVSQGGVGGSSPFGGGGAGRITDGNGNVAVGYGSGGGGAVTITPTGNRTGGNGFQGAILVVEFA